jgi:hypothetical protein
MLHDAIRKSARCRISYKVSGPWPSLKARPMIKTRRDIFHSNLLRVLGQFDRGERRTTHHDTFYFVAPWFVVSS